MSLLDRLETLLARRHEGQRVLRYLDHRELLPSNLEKLHFRAHIKLTWALPPGDVPSPQSASAGLSRLVEVAKQAARPFSVLHREEAESSVNKALWEVEPIDRFFVRADATLLVESADLEFAQQQRERDLATERLQAERQAEVARLTTLRDTLLRDAPTARLWWLDSDPKRLVELARHATDFEQAVALVSGDSRTEFRSPDTETKVAELIALFLRGLGPEHRMLLIHQVGEVFRAYDRDEPAERLQALLDRNASTTLSNGVQGDDSFSPTTP